MRAEYPAGHLERAHLEVHEAMLALLENRSDRALALALSALAVLNKPGGEQSGRALAEKVTRVARAQSGDCAPMLDPVQAVAVDSPLARAESAWMRDSLTTACLRPH